jgi:hypothetical protein
LLTASSALALASCGGEEQQVERQTVTGPTIDRPVAERLASRSDKIATLLDSGDACGAKKEAAALRADLTASIDTIPEAYLEDLSGLVNEIEAQIPLCAQVLQPPRSNDRDDEDNKGKGKGKDKDDDKDKDKDKDEGDD